MLPTHLSKVLVAIDFSAQSLALSECVYDLCHNNIKDIVLTHVFEDAKDAKSAGAIWSEVISNLTKYKKEFTAKGFNVKIVTPAGNPALEIVRLAEAEQVGLIIIASSGKGYIKSALLGSTSFDVARMAPCPVFIERGKTAKPAAVKGKPARLAKILLPTDFSAASLEALPFVRDIADSISEVLLAHVIEKSKSLEDLNRQKAHAQLRLQELVEELKSFGIKAFYTIKVEGTASRTLLQLMREEDITMSIFPRTGAGIIKGILIGSTAQTVLLNIDRPILMIPTPQD